MIEPANPVNVLIIDDVEQETVIMQLILQAWPNVSCSILLQLGEDFPRTPNDVDIILIDGQMHLSDSSIARHFWSNRYSGIIASTASNQTSNCIAWHFLEKTSLNSSCSAAKRFVDFFNFLLKKMEVV